MDTIIMLVQAGAWDVILGYGLLAATPILLPIIVVIGFW